MLFQRILLLHSLLVISLSGRAAAGPAHIMSDEAAMHQVKLLIISETMTQEMIVEGLEGEFSRPSPLFSFFKRKIKGNRKLTAALLAFPFPLGMVGMHRIYLGTAPYVPVVYIATIGGVFGILPFIDFCMILFEKDLERFSNNKKVFMWVD